MWDLVVCFKHTVDNLACWSEDNVPAQPNCFQSRWLVYMSTPQRCRTKPVSFVGHRCKMLAVIAISGWQISLWDSQQERAHVKWHSSFPTKATRALCDPDCNTCPRGLISDRSCRSILCDLRTSGIRLPLSCFAWSRPPTGNWICEEEG